MQSECLYSVVNEAELNETLVGRNISGAVNWPKRAVLPRLATGFTGVVWKDTGSSLRPVQPLVLVAREDDFRRLCGRFAQLRPDLSPLTAWCHLITPSQFESLDTLERQANLGRLTAAWSGLAVAEALLLTERPLAQVKISACLATQSFAIARARALWSRVGVGDLTRRFDTANRLLRTENGSNKVENRVARIRSTLQPVWSALIAASDPEPAFVDSELKPIVACLTALDEARLRKSENEAQELFVPVSHLVAEAEAFIRLKAVAPEQRLKIFDKLVETLDGTDPIRNPARRNALALLAGYLATVAAGGAPSLSLAEASAHRWPEITAWAYVMGSIGETVIWTSSFDGLGRLVARELMRSVRFDDPPTCDFALDEAVVLADPKLPDPLVHLRIKQARIITVSLLPGVNVAISYGESSHDAVRPEPSRTVRPPQPTEPATPRDVLGVFADAIWPHLHDRVKVLIEATQVNERSRGKKKQTGQPQLPLNDTKK